MIGVFLFFWTDTLKITMEDAVQLALKNNPTLKMMKEEVKEAEYRVRDAFGNFLPSAGIQAGYLRLSEVPVIEMPKIDSFVMQGSGKLVPYTHVDTMKMGSENNYSFEFSISQPLFTGGRLFNIWRISENNLHIARLEDTLFEKNLKYEVEKLYIYALVSQEFFKLAKKIEEELKTHYESIKKRYKEGYSTELELLQAEAVYNSQKARVKEAYFNYQRMLDNLKFVMGIPVDKEVLLSDSLSESFEKPKLSFDIEERYDMKILHLQKDMLRLQKKIILAKNLPQLFAGFSYSYKKPFGFEDEWRGTWGLNFGIKLSLFEGGKRIAELGRINTEIKKIEIILSQKSQEIQKEKNEKLRNYENAKSMLRIAKENLMVAEKLYKTARTQYEEGIATHLDFLNAETSYAQKRAEFLKALAELWIAGINLEQLKIGSFEKGGM